MTPLVGALAAVTLAIAPLTAIQSVKVLGGACAHGSGLSSCNGKGDVVVAGTRTAQPKRAGSGGGGGGTTPVTYPVGTTRVVSCAGAQGTSYAVSCAQMTASCAQDPAPAGQVWVAHVRINKLADGTWRSDGAYCERVPQANPPRVTAAVVREQVARLIPRAAVGLTPHGTTLVNIQTIMWVAAPARQTLPPVTILGQRVSITIILDRVAWDFGDGVTDTAAGAGKQYDGAHDPCSTMLCSDYFGHVYATTGDMTVRARAYWRASFRVGGGAAIAIPGTVAGPVAQAAVTVKQARAVLVDPTPR